MSKLLSDGAAPLVVGIGASAGGLGAFKKFFSHMPADNGMAFVLVQHLDPKHDSLLAELIGKQTSMNVAEARDGERLTANCVFIIPPDATLTVKGGVLRVTKPAPPRETRRPIDTFFTSLADDQGENAVCIVLSGTGTDGTQGLKAVKENGGLTLAQAEFDHHAMSGMPDSAVATGLVDQVMPVEAMPARLMEYRAHMLDVAGEKDENGTRTDTAEHLKAISAILRRGISHDFGQYKQNTLVRRVQRRMQVLQIRTVPAFIAHLEQDPHEVELLFREILIGVTQFFRDPLAFDALAATVVPRLLANKKGGGQIRIWVAGCATGEEVYSIAILFKEALAGQVNPPQVQIFGSDMDDRAIARARTGRYRGPLQGVSPERLARWFTPLEDDYCVAKEIREMCVFSAHSLIKDPPFSKLDLVSCRNVMIYFDRDLQDRALRNFHYALAPGGFLFLGASEGVTRNAALFSTVDKKHRIFERRSALRPTLPDFPTAPEARSIQDGGGTIRTTEDRIDKLARRVMAKHSPAYVVIDEDSQIVRFSGGECGPYLEPSAGVATLDLFAIVRKSLRTAVRSAVQAVRVKRETVVTKNLSIMAEGRRRLVTLIVEPLADEGTQSGLSLVAFSDAGEVKAAGAAKGAADDASGSETDLERELSVTKALLRGSIEELETTTEEMKSSNEEFQSVNEELQASNEELETAKEEMQSVNEELRTINAEMVDKNEQLLRLNSDLRNLLDSTQIATIFLDNELRIKSFTPGMVELIHLRDSDHGRPITELVSRLNYAQLEQDARSVLRTLGVVEREVRSGDESVLIMRIRPYRTVTNVIDGVVITFVDVTASTLLQTALKESERRLAAIVQQATAGIAETDLDGRLTLVNPLFCRIVGRTEDELHGLRMDDITHPDDVAQNAVLFDRLVAERQGFEVEKRYLRPDGTVVWVHNSVSPIVDADGRVSRVLAVVLEVTEHKLAEAHRELLLHELSHRVKNTLATVQSIAAQTAQSATTVTGYRDAFMARLMALAATHNLLQIGDWHGAALRDVVATELAPYEADAVRWTLSGADVLLKPDTAVAFGMVVHELTTNAAKYGALSNERGRVDVSWTMSAGEGKRRLHFVWRESGGPPVKAAGRKGFGTRLITDGLALQLDATIALVFASEGVRCTIDIPISELEP
ncbi:MAG: PAS domain S-box protein [Alphaproteobacteria bacterium]|nr:PAS domain S-box protein [Alphaproteobacteria bacterium]